MKFILFETYSAIKPADLPIAIKNTWLYFFRSIVDEESLILFFKIYFFKGVDGMADSRPSFNIVKITREVVLRGNFEVFLIN